MVRRVMITVPWAQRLGGAETMLWELLRGLDRERFEPVVVFFEAGPFADEVRALGHRTEVVRAGRLRQPLVMLRALRALAGLIRSARPALVVNWSAKTQLYGAAAALLAGRPARVLWWQHSVPEGHWVDRMATALPGRSVGCSSTASATAQQRLWPRRRTFVVNPGVDVELRPPVELPDAARGAITIGTVGRLQPWKGHHHLIAALARLRTSGHDVRGLIVGGSAFGFSAGYEAELRELVTDLGLEDDVTFTGQVDDAGPYLATMDVFVNASDDEPFGIVMPEAMAYGLPVVAVASAGPLEIVDDGETGMLVAKPDPVLLAEALAPLTQDAALRQRLGEAGRHRYEARFTADRMVREIESAFERASRL